MFATTAGRAVVAAATVLALTGAQQPGSPAVGRGDRLYPAVGDPGYDATAYDISMAYHGPGRPLDAVTRIQARAVTARDGLQLDFTGAVVRSTLVDGRPVRFSRRGERLLITPWRHIRAREHLTITITHTSDPQGSRTNGGWIRTPDGLALGNQPVSAHRVFPCNDHPSDKAHFTFRITTPNGITAVANGVPLGAPRVTPGGTTWTYRTAHPMATELAQIAIGRSAVLPHTGPDGLPLRDVVAVADGARLAARLALTGGQIAWMEAQVGRYPFETYGILDVDTTTGFELETQTLSLFERRILLAPEPYAAPLMVHELSHQWFGDSVTPATWSDLWLNEGHATWYEWRYRAEKYRPSLDDQARRAYERDGVNRSLGGPPALPAPPTRDQLSIFRDNVYSGGALALYALRQEIGDPAFRWLERAWVSRYRDGNASTADFIALASRAAGRDLSGFLHAWLYGKRTPAMPGHPDWRQRVRPVKHT
ncbi:M1 family metallopeptidase [Streptantibioticus ferralitis]|uniref:Aminopeptidase N n=1 Tax=Streptantibioticus ferralitis TaxID=236510 RepID=A0ABT5Z5Q5_9ACTN|nr:M1 family metallopeptidase [Streptantibioticus ferralitis]MDF2259128.1 M1 family metallopeptidase [Streptantibioticus ferralitis]